MVLDNTAPMILPPKRKRPRDMIEGRTYSSFDIMKALQIPKEKLRDWIDRGFVPTTKPSPGRGLPAVYSRTDIYGLALFMELISHGFPREKASEMVNEYRDSFDMYYPGDGESGPDIWTIDKFADYIIFRRETDEAGNTNIKVMGAPNDTWHITLWSGQLVPEDSEDEFPGHPDLKPWNSLLVINYKKIRDAVDEALAKV